MENIEDDMDWDGGFIDCVLIADRDLGTSVDIRDKQVFHVTLRNQLVAGKRGGHLLTDPNGFLYCYEMTKNHTQYYHCQNQKACHGRCKLMHGKELHITQRHWDGCNPNEVDIEVRRFKKELQTRCMNDTLIAFATIFNQTKDKYRNAAELWPFEKCRQLMYTARRRVTTKRLPTTLDELGQWMEDVQYYNTFGVDSMKPANAFFVGIHVTSDGSKFAAFKSQTVVDAATGGRIVIQLDGTFSIVPSRYNSLKQAKRFDNCHQLLMVHYRHRNRNYPLGYFLLSNAPTNVLARDILQLAHSWLGEGTAVITIITDYETSLRNAASYVCPDARLIGCAVHYQRAVANWCYKHHIMSEHKTKANLLAMRQAMTLCYMPRDFFEMAVIAIEKEAGANAFIVKLVGYLRATWKSEDISVFGEFDRSVNGCETFHWRIQRMHDKVHNNINQFIERLRQIESMCALSVKQFHNCSLSKAQMVVEKRHRDLEESFDLQCGREPDADRILRFLNASLHFSDNIYNHFVQCGLRKQKNVSGTELLIADRLEEANVQMVKHTKRAHYTVTLTPVVGAHNERIMTTKCGVELVVGRVERHRQAAKNNFLINDPSVSIPHASLWIAKDGTFEIRDNGSQNGTFVNGRRLSYSGVLSPCLTLRNTGDEVTFGSVSFSVKVTKEPTANEPIAPVTESIPITLKCKHGDNAIPERNIRLSKNVATVVGRATANKPATRVNALYQLPQIGAVHALLNWTGNNFHIKPMSHTYRTWLNGNVIQLHGQKLLNHSDELIFGANESSDHVKVTFLVDNMPPNPPIDHAVALRLIMMSGSSRKCTNFNMNGNQSIQIGRRDPEYVCQAGELMFRNLIVSQNHATLTNQMGVVYIRDEGSANGTYVNAKLLKPHTDCVALKSRDTIQLGAAAVGVDPVVIKFHCDQKTCPVATGQCDKQGANYRGRPITLPQSV